MVGRNNKPESLTIEIAAAGIRSGNPFVLFIGQVYSASYFSAMGVRSTVVNL